MIRYLNPFYIIILLEKLMTLAQDTNAKAQAAADAITKLSGKADTLISGLNDAKAQIAQLLADSGTLSQADTDALNAANTTLDTALAAAQAEDDKIDAAVATASAPSPAPAPVGDTGDGSAPPL